MSPSQLPEGKQIRAENKMFYFDIGQNNRGIFMRVSEVHFNNFLRFSFFLLSFQLLLTAGMRIFTVILFVFRLKQIFVAQLPFQNVLGVVFGIISWKFAIKWLG